MSNESRKQLIQNWGPEIVIKCCRYWKLHYANGKWGNCGFCRKKPYLTELTWDQVDEITSRSKYK